MFASSNRENFAKKLLTPHIEKEIKKRKKIILPSDEEMQKCLCDVLEEIANEVEEDTND